MAIGKKTGGRQKGTPNKITALARGMMQKWLEMHSSVPKGETLPIMMQDFAQLKPRDRVKVSAEFIRIIMPKTVSIDDTEGQTTLEEKLAALSVEE